ncbi:site-specific DNA-methyltransferase [Streptococcus parauberis]|uniref:site-specific DNA-methyltransferase n=1 Tax=Streptococcus parauberis TaxID=1348 RepID=UPI0002B936DE|nr:site-specific DNA-methyltransferase [Streptococcus parauberis]EMF48996.1 Type III restriction-modification system methylation subunit [Streptococcus parauberis KRS-02109]UWM87214.1 site-specific DNA-methyltransferase [Streptococcus parauberis]UWM89187.1 site-specific DNA-methyltransferase [Streptococcus parauberis]WEM59920.1 site-specific DNA-methyltransferase [Streptococcus parauberis]
MTDFIERPQNNKHIEAMNYIMQLKFEAQKSGNHDAIDKFEHIIDMFDQKKYGLVWETHAEIVEEKMKNEIPVFKEIEENKIKNNFETNSNNFLLEGDNLHSLHLLEKTHFGMIDVIYIDPPYNTGKEDFIYNDRFVDKNDTYAHSKWLSFMERRLLIASGLLSPTGVIFISIDDNEMATLKLLCDEIFGEKNFIASITRNTNSSKNQSLYVSVSHEYCLVYSKNNLELAKKHKDNKWNVEKNNLKAYKTKVNQLKKAGLSHDEITSELKELTKYPRFIDFTNYWYLDERGVYRKDNLGGVKNGNKTPLYNPITQSYDPVPPGGYRYKTDKLVNLVKENRIHFHSDGSLPTIKRYLSENSKQRPKSIMSDDQRPDFRMLKNMEINFDNPKQLSFMKRILSIFDSNSTILDFFAGSGTTGHAVAQLNHEDNGNRKYILCTNNENNICEEVTYKRLASIQKDLPHNLKYFRTEFLSKDDELLEEKLLANIKTLIELEYFIDLEESKFAIATSLNEIRNLNIDHVDTVYVRSHSHAMMTNEDLAKYANIKLIDIPEYYFSKEMKEAGL